MELTKMICLLSQPRLFLTFTKKNALMGDHPAHSLKKIDVDEFSTGETDANKLKTTDNDRNMIREYV